MAAANAAASHNDCSGGRSLPRNVLCGRQFPRYVRTPLGEERILVQFWYSRTRLSSTTPSSPFFRSTCWTWRNTRSAGLLLLKQPLGTTIKFFDFNWLVFRHTWVPAVPERPILEDKLFIFKWLVRLAGFEPATCCSGGEWLQPTQFTIPFPHIHLHVFGDSAFAPS